MAKTAVAQISGVEKAAVLIISLGVGASAEVLKHLSPDEVRLLSTSIASMPNIDDRTKAAVLEEFARARAAVVAPPAESSAKPRNFAAEIIDDAIERESARVSFEDISKLDDLSVKDVLKNVDLRTLCTALKAADDDVKEIIFRNMTDREAAQLRAEVLEIGPVRLREVEAAQESITSVMRSLLRK